MKIQIDTIAKTIKVEGRVKLADLFDQLQSFFPNGEWEDYDIETNTVIQWSNPIVIERDIYRHVWPWTVTCGGTYTITGDSGVTITNTIGTTSASCSTATLSDPGGVYNIELN